MLLLFTEIDRGFGWTDDLVGGNIPPYAILSHTWQGEEVTLADLKDSPNGGRDKKGYKKLLFCAQQAALDGLEYFWVDSCCIDRSNSVALEDAINSLFYCYRNAAKCYIYLSDISTPDWEETSKKSDCRWQSAFRKSKWFARSWTLQELLAPRSAEFFSCEGQKLGDKNTLRQTLHEITGIATQALEGRPLAHFSVRERLLWAANRGATLEEDQVYSLLGIFGIKMTMMYGEGSWNACLRFWDEIFRRIEDYTILLCTRPSDTDNDQQSAVWDLLAPPPTLSVERIKDTSEKLEWLSVERHSLLDLASTEHLASHLPSSINVLQRPEITTHGLRMSLFVKNFGPDLICWTYCTQESNWTTYAVCTRVVSVSQEKLANAPHLKGYASGEVYHVDVRRLKGFEQKTIYLAMKEPW